MDVLSVTINNNEATDKEIAEGLKQNLRIIYILIIILWMSFMNDEGV